jgi:hypothetical protein
LQAAQRATAARLLARHGALTTFRRYALVKDKIAGTQTPGAAVTVQARAAVVPLEQSVEHGIDVDQSALYVDGAPFAAAGHGDLTDTWRVVLAGAENEIVGPIVASRTVPGEPAAYFTARLGTG